MTKEGFFFGIAFAFMLAQCIIGSYGQGLQAIVAGGKLPTPLYYSTAVYDGNDSVYLFGGYTDSAITGDIIRYSIADDKAVKVSSLITPSGGGRAFQGKDKKSIYYFGGTSTYLNIQKFNTDTNSMVTLPTALPSAVLFGSGVSTNDRSGIIFIFGGNNRDVMEFDEASETAYVIAALPFQSSPVLATAAIPNGKEDGGVWIFAGNNPKVANPILLFNTKTKAVSIPAGNSTSQLPPLYEILCAVTDGRSGYIIGGLGRVPGPDGSYHPTNGMLRVNLDDASVTEFVPVANYPGEGGAIFDNTAAVYVEKLNRIYIFGGWTITNGVYRYLDKIWYIDLIPTSTTPPPTLPPSSTTSPPSSTTPPPVLPPAAFNCSGLAQGSYPHPTDCASFFICLDGELAGEFKCSSPDLFDPIQQTCNIPELVVCSLSCEGREDGLHPHPSDCSKYIVCRNSTIEVHDCPSPLLFEPALLRCNLPQLVNCSSSTKEASSVSKKLD